MVLFTQSLTQPILIPASWLAATPHLERGGELPGQVFRLSATAHGEASRGERERGDVAARQVRQEAARQHERASLQHELPTALVRDGGAQRAEVGEPRLLGLGLGLG